LYEEPFPKKAFLERKEKEPNGPFSFVIVPKKHSLQFPYFPLEKLLKGKIVRAAVP